MSENFFKTLIVIAIVIVLFYLVFGSIKKMRIMEGLDNMASTNNPDSNISSGETSGAASYAAQIKAEVIKLQDELLISKYRKDYESAIINLEDLINFSMLKLALDMKTDISKDVKNIEMLNSFSKAKSSLNEVMKFIDKQ